MKETNEVSREELITVEEEVALIKQTQQSLDNCEVAKEKLLVVNRRFVRVIAEKYATPEHPVEELILQGNKGLINAVSKYDSARGYKFISYSLYWIKKSIIQYINNN